MMALPPEAIRMVVEEVAEVGESCSPVAAAVMALRMVVAYSAKP
jgi:hypothetical protein